MNMGFDMDGVVAARPRIFKLNHVKGKYRITLPTWEQWFWRIVMIVRAPSKIMVKFLKAEKEKGNKLYLISGRLGFLEDLTIWWLGKHKLDKLFERVLINLKNEQPHEFKTRLVKHFKIAEFYEDEIFAGEYIKQNSDAKVFLVVTNGEEIKEL